MFFHGAFLKIILCTAENLSIDEQSITTKAQRHKECRNRFNSLVATKQQKPFTSRTKAKKKCLKTGKGFLCVFVSVASIPGFKIVFRIKAIIL